MRVRQPVYKSGPNAKHQARVQLSHMNQPAACITNGTVQLDSTEAVIEQDGIYYVASPKFQGKYYLVREIEGRWITSSKEDRFQAVLIAKVETFIAEQNELAQAA